MLSGPKFSSCCSSVGSVYGILCIESSEAVSFELLQSRQAVHLCYSLQSKYTPQPPRGEEESLLNSCCSLGTSLSHAIVFAFGGALSTCHVPVLEVKALRTRKSWFCKWLALGQFTLVFVFSSIKWALYIPDTHTHKNKHGTPVVSEFPCDFWTCRLTAQSCRHLTECGDWSWLASGCPSSSSLTPLLNMTGGRGVALS